MFAEFRNILAKDPRALWILIGGLIVQVLTSITAIGVSSADQHFQIVEFSLYQLGEPSGASQVWEINNFVRPTLQVYLFSGYHLLLNALGVTDPYVQLTILRVFLGIAMFIVFNAMALHYFKNHASTTLIIVLLLMNFSWALPYTRTLFSSEMMSSLFFFGTLLLYDYKRDKQPGFLLLMLVGFLFCIAFYFRFQTAFALMGVGIWILFFEKRYSHILPMVAGFVIGMGLNVLLDHGFYKDWTFTAYTYFHANIIAGRADYFGTSSFLRYIGLLLLVMPAPLFSFVVFFLSLKYFFKDFRNPLLLSVVLFVICHSLVGHKEERFLFPIFNALPIITGWSIPYINKVFQSQKRWVVSMMKFLLYFTVVLNFILLLVMTVVPYSQTILFSKKVARRFEDKQQVVYCVGQTPFETPNGSQMEFYKIAARNISVERVKDINELHLLPAGKKYLMLSFREAGPKLEELKAMGFKPVMSSSDVLWGLNKFLLSRNMQTIHEIWMLYERE